uniref:MHC class II beta chain N-terminal domain-containing protein n=1 Tax=Catharus ustulatus TaxID=91951 RepID=A0A8C3Y4Z1_CATUS
GDWEWAPQHPNNLTANGSAVLFLRHRLPERLFKLKVSQFMGKCECHFINGTEKVRLVERHIYNREEFARFDSDVGRFVGLNPHGEKQAQDWNRNPQFMEYIRALVDTVCRRNYKTITPFRGCDGVGKTGRGRGWAVGPGGAGEGMERHHNYTNIRIFA